MCSTFRFPLLVNGEATSPSRASFFKSGDHDIYVEPVVWKALEQHEFEGNVRELKNMTDYMITVSDGKTIQLYDTPPSLREQIKKKPKDKNGFGITYLNGKEEFAFLLDAIKQLNEKGEPASRRVLSELSKSGKSELTPQQVRSRLDYLEKESLLQRAAEEPGQKSRLKASAFKLFKASHYSRLERVSWYVHD